MAQSGIVTEKLNFLMNLTNTTNGQLSTALGFDPSYISRLRSGKRGLPRKSAFAQPLVKFFAERITEAYQEEIAAKEIAGKGSWGRTTEESAALILKWLFNEETGHHREVSKFLNELSHLNTPSSINLHTLAQELTHAPITVSPLPDSSQGQAHFFYGIDGKRAGVIHFLEHAAASEKKQNLLLFSDENLDWLTRDDAFSQKWSLLLLRILQNGGTIKIIHNVKRGCEEMLRSIQKWLPLYLSGPIEAYYCPRLRDGIYRRTLFLAEGEIALCASSIGEYLDGTLNILTTDKAALAAMEQEYHEYLRYCKPLMQIFKASPEHSSHEIFISELNKYELSASCKRIFLASASPALSSLPQNIAEELCQKAKNPERLRSQIRAAKARRRAALDAGISVTEIITLPGAGEDMPFCSGNPDLQYTKAQYAGHLRAISHILEKKTPGSRFYVVDEIPKGVSIFSSDCGGSLLQLYGARDAVIRVEEQNLDMALFDYLNFLASKGRKLNAERLEPYIAALS